MTHEDCKDLWDRGLNWNSRVKALHASGLKHGLFNTDWDDLPAGVRDLLWAHFNRRGEAHPAA